MRASDPAMEKSKRVCKDFPNLAVLTKSAMPGEIQLTFGHAAVGNKSIRESVVDSSLTGNISSCSVIYLKIEIAFTADGDKICLPIAEVLLCAAAGDLALSKKHREWTPRNAVLLPPSLTEATTVYGKSDTGDLLKIFVCSITKWAKDEDTTNEADEANDNDSVVTIDTKEAKATPGKAKQAAAKTSAAKR